MSDIKEALKKEQFSIGLLIFGSMIVGITLLIATNFTSDTNQMSEEFEKAPQLHEPYEKVKAHVEN